MNGKQRAPLWREHSDAEIANRARGVLRWKIRYDSIRVMAEKGHVTLLGEVNWNLDREAAEQTVRRLSGVVGVTNRITTWAYQSGPVVGDRSHPKDPATPTVIQTWSRARIPIPKVGGRS
jgi:osmotically-inducible protein OsmY